MGVLDSLLRFDGWNGDPLDHREEAPGGDPVFGADGTAPGRLAGYTRPPDAARHALARVPAALHRRALHRHLTRGWGMADPRVALLVDPSAAEPRSLMLGRRAEDFADPALIEPQVRMLLWYCPPRSAIVLRPETVEIAQMTPLASLFPAEPS